MASGGGELKNLGTLAIALVSLAAVTLTGIAVITQYKNSNLVDNTTADNFVTGLAIFGSFVGVLAISVIGKVIVNLFRKQ